MNTKFLMAGVVAAMVVGMTGCGSMDSIVKSNVNNAHKLAKDNSGIVVGLVYGSDSEDNLKKACATIGNADQRCASAGEYDVIAVTPGFGFAAADARVIALAPKGSKFNICTTGGGKNCSYAKVKAEDGKFATVIEVFKEGENGCHWSGMPRAGGVVCDDWDYRKDMRDWDTTNGVMTVKD